MVRIKAKYDITLNDILKLEEDFKEQAPNNYISLSIDPIEASIQEYMLVLAHYRNKKKQKEVQKVTL